MNMMLKTCALCPRACMADRMHGKLGYCHANAHVKIARAALHMWEEPCISGAKGSGTIFFSYCTLQCVFCQNFEISTLGFGEEISISRLAEIFLELQQKGAANINLVTPTQYVIQIIQALTIAKQRGLIIPILYNSSGYETVETLKLLEGYIDIYLPDFKYNNDQLAYRYSKVKGYASIAKQAIAEMVRQTGKPIFNKDGMMQKGVIVRHLILPGQLGDSKDIIEYLHDTYQDTVYISIMNQFTPTRQLAAFPEINRPLTAEEYEEVVQYALMLGVKNAFIQEQGTAKESFIPPFNLDGVKKEPF